MRRVRFQARGGSKGPEDSEFEGGEPGADIADDRVHLWPFIKQDGRLLEDVSVRLADTTKKEPEFLRPLYTMLMVLATTTTMTMRPPSRKNNLNRSGMVGRALNIIA